MPYAKRTTKYTQAEKDLISAMQRAGYSWQKIAEAFGYKSKTAIMNHAKKDPELKKMVQAGITGSIADVANSLYKKAMGYDYWEETYGMKKDEEGNEVLTLVKRVKKHVPADTFAMNSFLNNRERELWKPRRDDTEKKPPDVIVVSIDGTDMKQLATPKPVKDADYVVLSDEGDNAKG